MLQDEDIVYHRPPARCLRIHLFPSKNTHVPSGQSIPSMMRVGAVLMTRATLCTDKCGKQFELLTYVMSFEFVGD